MLKVTNTYKKNNRSQVISKGVETFKEIKHVLEKNKSLQICKTKLQNIQNVSNNSQTISSRLQPQTVSNRFEPVSTSSNDCKQT